MPVVKHRPNFSELITQAAQQRQKLMARQKKHSIFHTANRIRRANLTPDQSLKYQTSSSKINPALSRSTTNGSFIRKFISRDDSNDSTMSSGFDLSTSPYFRRLVFAYVMAASGTAHNILESYAIRVSRAAAIAIAFITLSMIASSGLSDDVHSVIAIMEIIIDVYFIILGALKFVAVFAKLRVKRLFGSKAHTGEFLRSSGLLDVAISSLSLALGSTVHGDWCRLVRVLLISTFALENVPHIDVLVSGISLGIRSLMSTWLLLTLVFFIYAAVAMTVFGANDPFHFGSIAMSLWTLFFMATLDNWGVIMYVNFYGCDSYPSQYVDRNATDLPRTIERYGTLYLPVCTEPQGNPVLSTVIFISFILLCGFILVSLTVAAVTAGINDRLSTLEKEDLAREIQGNQSVSRTASLLSTGKQDNSLITDPDMLLLLMKQVWSENEKYARQQLRAQSAKETSIKMKPGDCRQSLFRKESYSLAKQFCSEFDIRDIKKNSVYARNLTGNKYYKNLLASVVFFAAMLEIVTVERPEYNGSQRLQIVQIVLQVYFSLDICFKMLAAYPAVKTYFNDRWNSFDSVLVLTTWAPIFTNGLPGDKYLGLLRVLRILRLLRLLNWIADLNVIMQAIASSAKALVYVIMLMLIFFFHFAIAGVLLFRSNDPVHFGNLFYAFVTLFRVCSLDDWSETARINMYGCDYYGYDSGEEYYDSQCNEPVGLGWFAAAYFFVFVIFGVMVLMSLFVGIIITSMDLLKEGIKEEKEVWEKVKKNQKEHNIRDTTIDNLLEIFDLIDIGQNGKLTMTELKPVLEIVSVEETDQFSLFMMVDRDSSGQIDFAEFLELINLIGVAYKKNIEKLSLEKTPSKLGIKFKKAVRKVGSKDTEDSSALRRSQQNSGILNGATKALRRMSSLGSFERPKVKIHDGSDDALKGELEVAEERRRSRNLTLLKGDSEFQMRRKQEGRKQEEHIAEGKQSASIGDTNDVDAERQDTIERCVKRLRSADSLAGVKSGWNDVRVDEKAVEKTEDEDNEATGKEIENTQSEKNATYVDVTRFDDTVEGEANMTSCEANSPPVKEKESVSIMEPHGDGDEFRCRLNSVDSAHESNAVNSSLSGVDAHDVTDSGDGGALRGSVTSKRLPPIEYVRPKSRRDSNTSVDDATG